MIIPASNDIILRVYNQFSPVKASKITKREVYDYSLYSMLEFITFDTSQKKYVLKTLKESVKQEIAIHRFVTNFAINGSKFVAGYTSDFLNLHFIIMEYIEDIQPVYNFDDRDLIDCYAELATNLGILHVESNRFIRKLKKEFLVSEFNFDFYQSLIDKFTEKLPMLSAEIKNDLYLTPEIIEHFLQNKELIKNSLVKVKDLHKTLVHGDFDIGNIFIKPKNGDELQIFAIDWGLSHIDLPIVDVANLLNSLNILSGDNRNFILESYMRVAQKKFPRNCDLNNFQNLGMMLHRLFFIEFQLNTLERSNSSVEEYYEQIHNALVSLIDLSDKVD